MDKTTEDSVALMMLFGIIGMLVLAAAVIVFFLLYQRRLLAQQTNIKDLELAHQRESLELFIKAQEEERKRIAQDLHDGIGALLSASKMYINKLPSKELAAEDVSSNITFIKKETTDLLDETIDNIRSITRNLLPTSLERFGLFAATEDLCRSINDIGSLKIYFSHSPSQRFDSQQEFAVYRILQELINNSLKYAEATQIDIQLNIHNQQLKMTYQDNGKGFDLAQWATNTQLQKGLGLRGIQSRAEVLQAKLELNSSEGKGFSINLEMTINPSQHD